MEALIAPALPRLWTRISVVSLNPISRFPNQSVLLHT